MAKINVSLKHMQINKANSVVVAVVSLAAFVLVFTGFAVNALLDQRSYQARVISQKETAKQQLEENIKAAESLRISYQAFVSTPQNIIGGAPEGSGERDGDNARIVLDALPSSYDFPALITSIEKILNEENVNIVSIAGKDDELSQSEISEDAPIIVPFSFTVAGSYEATQRLINTLERSIRPFNINQITLSGDDSQMRLELHAHTYFQPEKKFEIERQMVQ